MQIENLWLYLTLAICLEERALAVMRSFQNASRAQESTYPLFSQSLRHTQRGLALVEYLLHVAHSDGQFLPCVFVSISRVLQCIMPA